PAQSAPAPASPPQSGQQPPQRRRTKSRQSFRNERPPFDIPGGPPDDSSRSTHAVFRPSHPPTGPSHRMDTPHLNEPAAPAADTPRRWSVRDVEALFELPFNDLIHRAHVVHRRHFDPNAVQLSTLLSVKTGGCPEDCGYCPQSARYHTGLENEAMMSVEAVVAAARAAKQAGATRFCMGAAWRGPKQRDLERVLEMVKAVRAEGLECCATLGLLREGQA